MLCFLVLVILVDLVGFSWVFRFFRIYFVFFVGFSWIFMGILWFLKFFTGFRDVAFYRYVFSSDFRVFMGV